MSRFSSWGCQRGSGGQKSLKKQIFLGNAALPKLQGLGIFSQRIQKLHRNRPPTTLSFRIIDSSTKNCISCLQDRRSQRAYGGAKRPPRRL